ncbi:hypothetical protein ACIPZG_24830 [Pseudomonas sp. NPDC089395]|uniref:hypothetical protein n=1 Tax=Pseudomonas sp. NPDC089395 TaxID=3364460 RepID=UPI00382A22D6
MLWFGSDRARFKLQRRIMGIVLFVAIFFLAAQIESYLSGCGSVGDVFDGLFLTSFAGGMFYLAGKW